MYELTPFERRSRNFAKYFDQLEKNFFGDNSRALSEIKTDIIDKGDHYLLQAELAGFNKEDIHVDIDDDRLMISAEHSEEKEEKNENYVRKERSYGSFARNFDISGIRAEGIKASYQNGVLELELPKKEATKMETRKVEIE